MTLAEWESYEFEPDSAQQDEPTREKLEALEQKLAAAQAEIRRYQTRLFAYERAMMALRRENAELEAKCETARRLSEDLNELFKGGQPPRHAAPVLHKQPIKLDGTPLFEQYAEPSVHESAEPPKTELQRIAYGLIAQFDIWLEQNGK